MVLDPNGHALPVIAIFGGSFDPPHVAHVAACRRVIARPDVERLLVVPAFRHPFDKPLTPFDERIALCEIALGGIERVEVSRIEAELGGDSVTVRTLEEIRRRHPNTRLLLVVGADVLAEWDSWYRHEDIRRMAELLVLGRPGYPSSPGATDPLPDVSSTEIRRRLAAGEACDDLVPAEVLRRIRERGLYRAAT